MYLAQCLLLITVASLSQVTSFKPLMPINAGSRVVGLSRAAVAIGSENEKNIGTGGAPMVLNPYLERLLAPVSPGIFSITIKGKALNFWGIFYALSCLVNAIVVLPFLILTSWSINLFASAAYKNKRTLLDWIIHVWAKAVLLTTGCNPTLYGEENLPPHGEPVIYVPNHTSFMDILTLSGFVPRPFKYLSKEEIVKIPVIGYAMKLAQHVFLKRNDITSIDTVTDAVTAKLKNGCGMVLFAEGTRSKDGVLKAFKKGAFKMAKAANVRIVPISIGNLHRFMPPSALMPLGPLRNIYIKVHPPIDTLDVPVNDLRAQTWEAVNSGLPPYQQGEPSKRMIKAANNKDGDE